MYPKGSFFAVNYIAFSIIVITEYNDNVELLERSFSSITISSGYSYLLNSSKFELGGSNEPIKQVWIQYIAAIDNFFITTIRSYFTLGLINYRTYSSDSRFYVRMKGYYGGSYIRNVAIAVLFVSKTINSTKTAYFASSIDGGSYFTNLRSNLNIPSVMFGSAATSPLCFYGIYVLDLFFDRLQQTPTATSFLFTYNGS